MTEFGPLERKLAKSMYEEGYTREEILGLINDPEFNSAVFAQQLSGHEFEDDLDEYQPSWTTLEAPWIKTLFKPLELISPKYAPAIGTAALGLFALGLGATGCSWFDGPDKPQKFDLTGTFVDQQGNPIQGAGVQYLKNTSVKASTTTDAEGDFSFSDVEKAGVGASRTIMGSSYDKPAPRTEREVEREAAGRDGEVRNSAESEPQQAPKKAAAAEGGSGAGTALATPSNSLRFTRDNLTTLEHQFSPQGKDQNLGNITGNVGPAILGQIPTQILEIGETMDLNMNDYVYNDDSSLYVPGDTNFSVVGSRLRYTGLQPDTLSTVIDITDPTDAALVKTINVRVEIPYENFAPAQVSPIGNQAGLEGFSRILEWKSHFEDQNGDVLSVIDVLNIPNINYQATADSLALTHSDPDFFGTVPGIVVRVGDPGGLYVDSDPFDWIITNVNDAPHEVTPIGNKATPENQDLDIIWPNHVDDIDNLVSELLPTVPVLQNAAYTVIGDTLRFSPDNGFSGLINDVVVRITDPGGLYADLTGFDWNVTDVNNAPYEVSPIGNQVSDEGVVHTFEWRSHVDDIDGNNLSVADVFNLTNANYEVVGDSLKFTHDDEDFNGALSGIVVRVQDPGGLYADLTPFDWVVNPVNDIPYEISPIGNKASAEGETLKFNWREKVADKEGDSLSVADVLNLNGATYQAVGDTLEVTPLDENYNGSINGIVVQITDGVDTLDMTPFDWTVNPVDDAPYEISPIGNQASNEGVVHKFNWKEHVGEYDGEALSIVDVLNLTSAAYQAVGDSLEFIHDDEDFNGSINGIVVQVTDGNTTIGLTPFDWVINPVNDAPYEITPIGNQASNEGETHTFEWRSHAGDIDGDALSVVDVLNLNGATYQAVGDSLEITPPNVNFNGSINGIAVRVGDGTDTVDLTPFDWTINPVNWAPYEISPIGNRTLQEGKSIDILADDVARDVETLFLIFTEVRNLDSRLYDVIADTLRLYGDPALIGTHPGIVAVVGDGSLTTDLTPFDLTVEETAWSDVTFNFKAVYADTLLDSGTSTLVWREIGTSDPDSTKTDTDGIITHRFMQGVPYEINGLHDGSVDGVRVYTFFQKDGQIIEQRSYRDETSPITFNEDTATVVVYKLMNDFPLSHMMLYASYGGGVNIGTRRFGDNDLNAPAWWNANYEPSDATRRQWLNEVIDDLKTVPHVGLNLQYQEGTTVPSVPYLWLGVDSSFPGPGTNGTTYNSSTHEIIECHARYPPWPGEPTFKIEILQAIGDLEDSGGSNPAILELSGGKYKLNDMGRRIFSLLYLAKPKTKF